MLAVKGTLRRDHAPLTAPRTLAFRSAKRELLNNSRAKEAPMSTLTTLALREQLILQHLPLVRLLARRSHIRCHRQVEFDDLFQAGVLGLIQAVDRFQPERQCLLKTLADHRIRGAILDYLRQLDPLPRSIRRFVRRREETELRLERHLGRPPMEAELACVESSDPEVSPV